MIERLGQFQPFQFNGFTRGFVRNFLRKLEFDKGKRVAMSAAIGVDVRHDGIEPATEIVAAPLRLVAKRALERVLNEIATVID
nr:hypothetical protein [Marinicella sp. W31]MDC2877353.1 hypothetical protein [Marinicella sp. W31]